MLIVARREGEGVFVGRGIKIVVIGVQGGIVRLGFRAPEDVAISRDGAYTEEEHGDFQREREVRCLRPRAHGEDAG